MAEVPVLYSFRRCPYAMRARMAVWVSGVTCELREVKLADKPAQLLEASPKGTVPVLLLPDGRIIDESLDVMMWALSQSDPEHWLDNAHVKETDELIARNDGPFKHHLDRYKYPTRYDDCDSEDHRSAGASILADYNARLTENDNLLGKQTSMADIAIFPFIRQFANTDRKWFDAQPLPHLQAWLERHIKSDIFTAIMVKYSLWKMGDEPVFFGKTAR